MFTLFFLVFFVDDTDNLIKGLGDSNFYVRENAQVDLIKKMDFNLYLRLRDIKEKNLEIIRRLEVIKKNYKNKLRLEYKVTIDGYFEYPWIDMIPYEYKGEGMQRCDILEIYLFNSEEIEVFGNKNSCWPSYRKATQRWIKDRIYSYSEELFKKTKSEKDFQDGMNAKIAIIQKDMEAMVIREDDYWKFWGKKNPARIKNKLLK